MATPLNIILFIILGLFLAIIGFLAIRLNREARIRKRLESRFVELENKANTLQLQTLEARLNPHLFKNILNSIQSHAYQTYFAMDKLSNVLDFIFYGMKQPEIIQ